MRPTLSPVRQVLWSVGSALVIGAFLLISPASAQQQAASQEKKLQDRFGDALPDGAIARMGTIRWRHPAAIIFVGYTNQGKHLLTSCMDGLHRVWEVASGKEIRRFGDAAQQAGNGQVVMINGNARVMFTGIGGSNNLALSRDGKVLATQAADGTQLWDVASGKKLRTLAPNNDNPAFRGVIAMSGMAFSPDGATLAVRGFDQVIRLWNVADGKELLKIAKQPDANNVNRVGFIGLPSNGGRTLVFSADGKTILSSGISYENQQQNASIQSFDAKTGKELRQHKLPINNVGTISMTFAPDGKSLAWSLTDGAVRLLDTESGKEIGQFGKEKQQGGYVLSLVYSVDGKTIAGRRINSAGITLWDAAARKELHTLGGVPVQNANPFGARFFIGGFGGYGNGQETVAFSPDGKTLVEVTNGNSVRFWTVADGKEIQTTSAGHHGGVIQVAAADGKKLITRGADGTVRHWEMATGQELEQVKLPADTFNAVLAVDGKTIFCATTANSVRVLDAATGKELRNINVAPQQQGGVRIAGLGVGNLAVSPDGKRLGIAGYDQTIRVFDAESGKEIHNLSQQTAKPDPKNPRVLVASNYYGGAMSLAFSPNGRLLCATGVAPQNVMWNGGGIVAMPGLESNSAIRLWDLSQARRPRAFDSKTAGFSDQTFTPDSAFIVTANFDNTISIWETLTGKECLHIKVVGDKQPAANLNPVINARMARIAMQTSGAARLALSPDGRTLAVTGNDQAIRLFDLRSGRELGKFQGHNGQVMSLAFAPDGKTLISGSADTTALVWDGGRFIKSDPPRGELTAEQVNGLWQDLAADPVKAYQAILGWRAAPRQAIAQFKEQLRPAVGIEAKHIEQLIADLETAKYESRQKATDELEKLGELAEPALRKAMTKGPSLEMRRRLDMLIEKIVSDKVPPAETLRALRAVQILEQIGNAEARVVLQRLADGAPGHRLTRQAQAALKRP